MIKTWAPALRGCAVALLLACLVAVTVAQPRVGGAPTVSVPVMDKIRVRLQQKKDLVMRTHSRAGLPPRGLGPPVQQCNNYGQHVATPVRTSSLVIRWRSVARRGGGN